MKRMLAGLIIDSKSSFGEPPTVKIHKLGDAANIWLTPKEARALAALLTEAATDAENGD